MYLTGNQVRQSFLDFFARRGHTVVPSASLVPGGDSTLLFTNSGMVQFKDVFLGTDSRPYTRAVDSQKCLRVAGKHNDLDTVGRDNTHHTFFEMLGNWSFGDYYKKEAIAWSWELLTQEWGLDPKRIHATVFRDDQGNLPQDDEAAEAWLAQPGFEPTHLYFGGRKDNLWEMAETGPCGPCSEIHYDFGPEFCDMQNQPGHVCEPNGDCQRIIEIWNNVFIQYNRTSPTNFEPLPKKHVDTGMGFERIVSIIQNVPGNYDTDLLKPLLDEVQRLSGQSDEQRQADPTPYRVIADHVRAAAFLIADGVIPGNIGRNYICRMIIRRAARFARKLGLKDPFMAQVAAIVVKNYGAAYPELPQNSNLISTTLTREEKRFNETLDAGFSELNAQIDQLKASGAKQLDGKIAFNLYATLGFPLEITRDILEEEGLEVDEKGFYAAMEAHRDASSKGSAFSDAGSQNVELYAGELQRLQDSGRLGPEGVAYDPYSAQVVSSEVLALFSSDETVSSAEAGDAVELLLDADPLYIESGGQVSDSGRVLSDPPGNWEVEIHYAKRPAAGAIVLQGKVLHGSPAIGDKASVEIDMPRRKAIMRNHTATHLLHAALHTVLGQDVHQSGSAVDPERLRFDFNYPHGVSKEDLLRIEGLVNEMILGAYPVQKEVKSLDQARAEGAIALFGEKYGSEVRTVEVRGPQGRISYELCGGTHVDNTVEIASFYITAESSVAAGVRRIEAVTGQKAYEYSRQRLSLLNELAGTLETSPADAVAKLTNMQNDLHLAQKENEALRNQLATQTFSKLLNDLKVIKGVPYLNAIIPEADAEALRKLSDQFRQANPSGVVVLGSVQDGKPILIAAVTPDLIARGLKAGELIKRVAQVIGGGGGGRPDLAQAGGKYPEKLSEALDQTAVYIRENIRD